MREARQFIFAFLFSLSIPVCSWSQDVASLKMILELPAIDNLSIDPEAIEKRCSEVLSNRAKEKPERILMALKHRALAYMQLHKSELAKADFVELLKLRPKDSDFHAYLAVALLELQKFNEGIEEAKEAIRLNPTNAMAHGILGTGLFRQGDKKGAFASFDKAISIDAKDGPLYYSRGTSYLMEGDPIRALHDINRFLELSPYDRTLPGLPFLYKGNCLLQLNRPKEALACFLLGRQLNPNLPHAREGLANCYGDLQKNHLAAHYAHELTQQLPDVPPGYLLAARYQSRLGNKAKVDESIQKLLRFPPHPMIFCEIGKANCTLGRHKSGIECFDKGLELDPEHLQSLIEKAHLLATCPDEKVRNGPQALKLATRAYENKNTRDWQKWQPAMVLAEAHAECSNFKEAVRYAKQALQQSGPDFGRREEFLEKLSLFEKMRPYREKVASPTD